MITKRILAILLMTLTTLTVLAQKEQFNPVYTGVTSLSIAPDARAGALGDVGVATEPDVNSQYWNPAKYPFTIARAGVSMSYTPWLRQIVSDIDLVNRMVGNRYILKDAVIIQLESKTETSAFYMKIIALLADECAQWLKDIDKH